MMLNEIAILECPRIQLSFFRKLPYHSATNIVDLHGQFNNGLNNSLTTRKYFQGLSVCMSYINSFVDFLILSCWRKHPDTYTQASWKGQDLSWIPASATFWRMSKTLFWEMLLHFRYSNKSFPVFAQRGCSYPQGKSQSKQTTKSRRASSRILATFMLCGSFAHFWLLALIFCDCPEVTHLLIPCWVC